MFPKLYLALDGCLVAKTVRTNFKSVKHKCRHSLGKPIDLDNVGSLVLLHFTLSDLASSPELQLHFIQQSAAEV